MGTDDRRSVHGGLPRSGRPARGCGYTHVSAPLSRSSAWSLPRSALRAGAVGAVLCNRSSAVAFLGYHSVADHGPPFLSVPTDTFERQLATLRRTGWRSGTSRDLGELVAGRS